MQLAMLRQDSGGRSAGRAVYGSEWTVAVRPGLVLVALFVGARQQLLQLSDKASGKVTVCFGRQRYSPVVSSSVLAEASGACPKGLASLCWPDVDHGGLLAVRLNCVWSSSGSTHTMHLGCWRPYGFIRPVLKHGPRSLTCAQVLG